MGRAQPPRAPLAPRPTPPIVHAPVKGLLSAGREAREAMGKDYDSGRPEVSSSSASLLAAGAWGVSTGRCVGGWWAGGQV